MKKPFYFYTLIYLASNCSTQGTQAPNWLKELHESAHERLTIRHSIFLLIHKKKPIKTHKTDRYARRSIRHQMVQKIEKTTLQNILKDEQEKTLNAINNLFMDEVTKNDTFLKECDADLTEYQKVIKYLYAALLKNFRYTVTKRIQKTLENQEKNESTNATKPNPKKTR